MFQPRGIFSESYNNYLLRKDRIRSLVLEAKEFLRGNKIFGEEISLNNPEELIAFLYVIYKDKEMFHEELV